MVVNEVPLGSVEEHLRSCGSCQDRVSQLESEIETARGLADDLSQSDSLSHTHAPLSPWLGREDADLDDQLFDRWRAARLSETLTRPLAVIGKYFVLETISVGGQSTVFRGFHPSLLIDVVIKLAHQPCLQDETGRARLVTEAKALAEIDHPHLARLYDLEFFEDRPFLVLEYVRGKRLGDFRDGSHLTPSQIASLLAKVARAVSAAHERGILHLDLKPDNIMVTLGGEPVLIDFGMSILQRTGAAQAPGELCIAGTPQYMSPEQTRGRPAEFDARTDIFGLGAVLYDLCVGQPPFAIDGDETDSHSSQSSEPDWNELSRAPVPHSLQTICRKAMSSDPEARYESAEEFAEQLEAVSKRLDKRRTVLHRLAAMLVLTLGVFSLLVAWWMPGQVAPERVSLGLQVVREFGEVPLRQALPIMGGDHLRLQGWLSETAHLGMFALTDNGQRQWLGPLKSVSDQGHTRVAFPDFTDTIALSDDAGTLLILLVSQRESPVYHSKVLEVMSEPESVPTIPSHLAVVLHRDDCEVVTAIGLPVDDSEATAVQEQLQEFRQRLAIQFDDFAGILIRVKAGPASSDPRLDITEHREQPR